MDQEQIASSPATVGAPRARRVVARSTALLLALAAAAGISLSLTAPADAATRKCGIISCTWYLNRIESNDFKNGVTVAGVGSVFIPGFGPLTAAGAGLSVAAIDTALNHNYCVKLKVGPDPIQKVKVTPGFYPCP